MKLRIKDICITGLLALFAVGCSSSNLRLDTDPADALVTIPSMNLVLTTPCDLPEDLDADDEIIVAKDGYQTFFGEMEDVPQTANGTYRVRLEPVTN